MRHGLPLVLVVPAMILAHACMAQAREDQPRAEAPEQAAPQEPAHRSAFGRVMALMIGALQAEALGDEANLATTTHDTKTPADDVHTTAIGTPLGIEVGEAFRLDPHRKAKAAPMPLAVQAGQADPGR